MTSIREKLEQTSWCAQAVAGLRQELNELIDRGVRIPEEPGGWWHQYVCPEHHAELLFEPSEEDARTFRCPHGCSIEGEEYRAAWLVFKHQSLARYALQAAAVYAAEKDARYAELGLAILSQYAAQFPRYPVHPDAQPWMLKGRAFHQALTEAIWSTTLIRAYLLLKDEGVNMSGMDRVWANFLAMLESSMVEYRRILIHDRGNPESNYTAWLNASLSCVYAAQGERGKLEELLHDRGGLRHHLSIGVKPDGFEFEGSAYYHVFVLRAYLITAEMAERFGIDMYGLRGDGGQSFESMFDVLAGLANERGELPALHDGPYKRIPYAREIAEIMEIGFARYGKPDYAPVLAEAYRQLGGSPVRTGLEAVMYGTGDADLTLPRPAASSLLLPDSGFAIGRHALNPLSFLIDFGPHGGSHGHYDKLHVSIEHSSGAVSPEMGMVPYGSALRKEWFAETASHNTIAVGGRSQQPHEGECVKFISGPDASYVWARSAGAYEGCILDRHVMIVEQLVVDWAQAKLEKEDIIDLWFHSLYPFTAMDGTKLTDPSATFGKEGGYALVKPRHMLRSTGDQFRLLTGGTENRLHVTVIPPRQASVYLAETPGCSVDPSRPAYALLQRVTGADSNFIQIYSAGEAAEAELSGDTLTVRCSGKTSRFTMTDEGLRH
ncbi:heparinase II/III domain-containing protein [Paenibacillus hamazuiensis]|uniref:heparinase II/III domain-containing protein n=1 Tax=Paenibacillus hamazuiensis TaxID=2936508 RepID=UPI00200E91AC|nr:heparinase II/III family protein [Paenibacillus hamazuiensis]